MDGQTAVYITLKTKVSANSIKQLFYTTSATRVESPLGPVSVIGFPRVKKKGSLVKQNIFYWYNFLFVTNYNKTILNWLRLLRVPYFLRKKGTLVRSLCCVYLSVKSFYLRKY